MDTTTWAASAGLAWGAGEAWAEAEADIRQMNRPDGKKILEQISRETGGRFFEVSHKWPLDKVFEAIEEDLRNQYNLGYTSDQQGTDRGYRRIHLTTKQKGTVVQTREGYYPVT